MSVHRFEPRSDCVEPHTLPKLLALAPVADGEVSLDGQTETRKARKIRVG